MAKTKLYTIYMGLCGGACSKWRLRQLCACRLQTCGATRGRDLEKSTTYFYQGRLTNSFQVGRIYVALEISALKTDSTIEQCECGFQAAQLSHG